MKYRKSGQTRPGKEADMEENMNQTLEQEPETTDSFFDGWGGDDENTADQPFSEESAEETGEETKEEEENGNQGAVSAPEVTESAAEDQQETPPAADAQPKTWVLRHLGEERTVEEEELLALAQKGEDAERIRSQYEEWKPTIDVISHLANQNGMNAREYSTRLREQLKQAEGLSEEDARRAVALEDREAAVSAAEEAQRQQTAAQEQAQQAEEDARSRRQADIEEFQRTFPEAAKDPNSIPPEVWEKVRNGSTLVGAYASFAVQQARQEAENAKRETGAIQQNQKNTARSTGSMRSAGDDSRERDDFGDAFDAG